MSSENVCVSKKLCTRPFLKPMKQKSYVSRYNETMTITESCTWQDLRITVTLFSVIILAWTYYVVANHCFGSMLNYNIYMVFVSPTSGLISVISIDMSFAIIQAYLLF